MRGGIGGYPEIRRENEAGIKEVAARPFERDEKGKGGVHNPRGMAAFLRWQEARGGGKVEKYGGNICEMPTGQVCSHCV